MRVHDTASSLQVQSMACSRLRSLKGLLQRGGTDTKSFANAPALLHPMSWCACPLPWPETCSCVELAHLDVPFENNVHISVFHGLCHCVVKRRSTYAQASVGLQGRARSLYSDKCVGNACADSHGAFQGTRGRIKQFGSLLPAGWALLRTLPNSRSAALLIRTPQQLLPLGDPNMGCKLMYVQDVCLSTCLRRIARAACQGAVVAPTTAYRQ